MSSSGEGEVESVEVAIFDVVLALDLELEVEVDATMPTNQSRPFVNTKLTHASKRLRLWVWNTL